MSRARVEGLIAVTALLGVLAPVAPADAARAAQERALACRAAYDALYARDAIRIRMVFGYKDARPARFVGDRYERVVFTQWLEAPCHEGESACGFSRAPEDAELFRKSVTGPDGRPRAVEVRVVSSSAGPDDEENRKDPYQSWRTRHAREEFLEGLRHADVVFYNGHSRDGGGPDFEPPRLGYASHVDYGWYSSQQPGLKEMIAALKDGNGGGARLVGMFSCASTGHFAQEILSAKKGVGVLASRRLIYFSDALDSSRLALGALLAMKCQPDFDRAIQVRSNQAGTTLLGFL